ncbi:MAG: alpha/beta fold hydrolase, partial [Bdellovibrionales bacterium]
MFKVFAVWLTGIGMGMGMGIGIGMGSLSAAAETSMDLEELQVQYPARYFQTVHLPSGRVHYQLAGNGPVIILIHGVSGPMAVWDRTYEALVGAGYRVVRFDLLGRGFSERLPDSAYSLGLYVRQLEELIAALDLGTGVRLIGSSFGAVIATEYALHHPDSVKGLVLIGPAGFPLSTPPVAKLGRIPLVGEFMTALFSYRVILEQNHRYFVSGQLPEELQPYIEDHLAIEGTTDAILRTMQNPSLQSFVDSYRTLAGFDIPVGVVWGVQDKTFPVLYASTLLEALPHAEFVAIERAGHLPQYESAIEVNRALVNILKSFPAAESLRAAIRPARLAFPKHTEREIEREALDRGAKEDRLFGFEQPFFKELSLEEREIQLTPQVSRIYRFPTLYDQVTASGALFLCDYEAAAQRLPPGLRPVHFGAGRAAVMISSFRYGRV